MENETKIVLAETLIDSEQSYALLARIDAGADKAHEFVTVFFESRALRARMKWSYGRYYDADELSAALLCYAGRVAESRG